jgi:hypothetical protein
MFCSLRFPDSKNRKASRNKRPSGKRASLGVRPAPRAPGSSPDCLRGRLMEASSICLFPVEHLLSLFWAVGGLHKRGQQILCRTGFRTPPPFQQANHRRPHRKA